MCFGCSKEPSHRDGSFEYPQHTFYLINKKNNFNYFQQKKQTFCGFSMCSNQYWVGRVYDLYVYFMTGTPEGYTESGFMVKPGIKSVTAGLKDIGLSPTPQWLHD